MSARRDNGSKNILNNSSTQIIFVTLAGSCRIGTTAAHVRPEAVKSLSRVNDQKDYLHSVTNFTDQFKSRLLETATSDIDLSIRVAVIRILGDIESHFPLEEEEKEKEKLCFLPFDEELRVRRAVSSFVKTVWEEEVDEKLASLHMPSEKNEERIGIKALAEFLVKWGKALDSVSGDAELGDEDTENGEGSDGRQQSKRRKELIALVATEDRGRISMAVEALWTGKIYWKYSSSIFWLRRMRVTLALLGEDRESTARSR